MITFANCKINLGLQVLRKRADGYHDISTVMIPVPWCDIVEALPAVDPDGGDSLTITGNPVDCPIEKNLVMKALRALRAHPDVPVFGAVDLFLHKVVPDGAGLGGGSSDAAHTIRAINALNNLGLDTPAIADIAARVGSDCAFFAYDIPMYCTGTGTRVTPIQLPQLRGKTLVVAKPHNSAVNTGSAYAMITPDDNVEALDKILQRPLAQWQEYLINDFEAPMIRAVPAIGHTLQTIKDAGAIYAAMSGSGAAVFGIFDDDTAIPELLNELAHCDTFSCTL